MHQLWLGSTAVARCRGWPGWRVKLGIRTRPKSVARINCGLDQPTYACIVQLETVQLKIDQLKYVQLQHCLIGFLFNSPKCSVSFWASGFWPIYCLFKNITCSVGYLFDRPVTIWDISLNYVGTFLFHVNSR